MRTDADAAEWCNLNLEIMSPGSRTRDFTVIGRYNYQLRRECVHQIWWKHSRRSGSYTDKSPWNPGFDFREIQSPDWVYIKILILWTVDSESRRSISCGILLFFPTVAPGITADRAMQVPSPWNGILVHAGPWPGVGRIPLGGVPRLLTTPGQTWWIPCRTNFIRKDSGYWVYITEVYSCQSWSSMGWLRLVGSLKL